jgi:hypothetical protein
VNGETEPQPVFSGRRGRIVQSGNLDFRSRPICMSDSKVSKWMSIFAAQYQASIAANYPAVAKDCAAVR